MARQMTSVILLLTPILVLNALRFLVTPLGEMMSVSPMLDMSLHVVSLGIGIVLLGKHESFETMNGNVAGLSNLLEAISKQKRGVYGRRTFIWTLNFQMRRKPI